MIIGQTKIGGGAVNLAADKVRVTAAVTSVPTHLSHLACFLDGLGPNAGYATIRGVIYDATDRLVAVGDEIRVHDGQQPGWQQLRFAGAGGLALPAGAYSVGLIVGGVTNCARVWVDDPGGGGSRQATDAYADGPASPLPAPGALSASLPVYGAVFEARPDPAVGDLELARLPWDVTQGIFTASGALRQSKVTATAGWHGTALDPETGAVGIVRSDGPLAALVGERLRVSRSSATHNRSVVVFIHDEQTFPDETAVEDLSLSRRAFLELAPLAAESAIVTVEVMA